MMVTVTYLDSDGERKFGGAAGNNEDAVSKKSRCRGNCNVAHEAGAEGELALTSGEPP